MKGGFLQFLLGVTVASSLLMTGKLHIPVPFMMISGPVYREEGFFMLAKGCGRSLTRTVYAVGDKTNPQHPLHCSTPLERGIEILLFYNTR